ncbi:hypothetical protein K488DRAFT_87118 [Vararia minispora EC-137]|uniref:Uncharacterized protein n=1 Tax=Vararia minispora EC-137 TaxID=1314806 RepID=A0ACB8QHL9_9AGAM|nr:hypothetical protein K488DRAFT_87118 [Vararia minispora EC-137]
MATRPPFKGFKRRLVAAFDLGTTFSGVSYAILDPGKVPEIKTVMRYPGQETRDSKIETVIYYDAGGKVAAAGAEIPIVEDSEDADDDDSDGFKLLLSNGRKSDIPADIPRTNLPPSKGIVNVFADFYAYLFDRLRAFISETHASGDLIWDSVKDSIDFVLSHPNAWEGQQQAALRQAAVLAGLVPTISDAQERITFVTEGEASFHYCVSSGLLLDAAGTNLMVIDAGGGTIDFGTYTFVGGNSIEVEELAAPTGIYQGAVMVPQRAHTYLKNKLEQAGSKFASIVDSMAEEFDKTTKKRFKGAGDSYIRFSNSASDRDSKVGIRGGQIKLTADEVAGFFDPAVREIITIIEDQQKHVRDRISIFLLVGGFASSEYLYTKLKTYVEKSGCKLYRPDAHANKAVAEGAVSFHIDHFVSSRVAKLTYGSRCTHVFDSNNPEHAKRASNTFVAPNGLQMLDGGFKDILVKGTQITEDTLFERPFYIISRFGVEKIECEVICHRGDNVPKWMDEEPELFSTLCTITADVAMVPKVKERGPRGDFCRQEYNVVLSFGLTEFSAHISWMDKGVQKTGPASIVYDDNLSVQVSQ